MTDIHDSRIRELVGRAGDQAPPMPTLQELEVKAALVDPGRPDRPGKRVALVAAVIIIALGIGAAWLTQRNDAPDVVATDESRTPTDSAPVEAPTAADDVEPWPDGAWPVLPAEADLEMEYAQEGLSELRVVGYRTRAGSQVWVAIVEPQPGDQLVGPGGTVVDVAGAEGVLEAWGEEGDSLVRVSWERDGLRLFVDAEDLLPEEVVRLAESVMPVAESELPVSVISTSATGDGERFVVAAAGEHTLTASTSDGRAFFLWQEPDGGGGGPHFLVGDDLLQVTLSRSQGGSFAAGIVSQAVADLGLRMTDGSTQPIEIQSRDLGYEVAFFLTSIDDLAQLEAVEAYDTEGTVIDTESFSD